MQIKLGTGNFDKASFLYNNVVQSLIELTV